jgi:hypothetical protein
MKRITVQLEDEALYAAVQAEAARRDQPLDQAVAEALRDWLEASEDADLQAPLEAARAEWRATGGAEAGEFFQQLGARPDDSSALPC